MNENFEKELPENYKEILHINAKDAKFGIIMNLISIAITCLFTVIGVFTADYSKYKVENLFAGIFVVCAIILIPLLVYIILHELVHGIAYKALTKEKLTFGISWSCAYCGVPNIYVYRRASMIALIMPFAIFSIVFLILGFFAWLIHPIIYISVAVLFGVHFGGCSGDLYIFFLYLFKFKSKTILMRDTGPEQFFFQKVNE